MKGVLLAGGKGSRMGECTKVTNKHLFAVYDKPMIYYPLRTLKKAGIENILIVTGGEHIGAIAELLGDGSKFEIDLSYKVQEKAGGISQALGLSEKFVNGENLAVILGDNYFNEDLDFSIKSPFTNSAKIFLKEIEHPKRFGVAEIKNNNLVQIVEKPENPKSNLAVTGLYLYGSEVFDIIRTLKPSERGELEITDVNNHYIKKREMDYSIVEGYWGDMGEPDTLLKTANYIANKNLREFI